MAKQYSFILGILFSCLLFGASSVLALPNTGPSGKLFGFEQPATYNPAPNVSFDQRLNEQIPLDLTFTDEKGNPVQLKNYFGDKPVILSLAYYECPMLCTLVLNGLVRTLRSLSFSIGKEFNVLTVSFDAREKSPLAAEKKQIYLDAYRRPEAEEGWHFLTGTDDAIQRLTKAVGFQFSYDEKAKQFAHASGIIILTPQGKISRYLYGIEYAPRDVRLGLVEAAAGKIGSAVDQVLLLCFHYDPASGKYSFMIMRVIQLTGLMTLFLLGSYIFRHIRRERHSASIESASPVLAQGKG